MKRVILLTVVLLSVLPTAQAWNLRKNRSNKAESYDLPQPMIATPQVEVQTQTAPKTEQTPAKAQAQAQQTQTQAQAQQQAPAAAKSEAVAQPQGATQTPAQSTEQAKVAEQPKSEVQSTAKATEQPKTAEPAKHNDHLPKANTAAVTANNSIKPVKTVDRGNVIDTLATANKNLAVVLFNDNTWMYIQTGNTNADKNKVFSSHWSDVYTNPYFNVPLSSLPESTPIQLVDSLRAYHYPYKGYVTSRYGPRNGRRHAGMDISLRTGDTIRAVFNGKVRYSRYHENGYGELIIVRHDNGLETFSAHLSKRLVKSGERVVAGQPIGLGGSTGRSTGPHLHFEFRYKGHAFDPERIIDFKTGNLRRDFILLKRSYFDVNSRYDQDFNSQVKPKTTTTTTTAAKTTTSTSKPSTSTASKSTSTASKSTTSTKTTATKPSTSSKTTSTSSKSTSTSSKSTSTASKSTSSTKSTSTSKPSTSTSKSTTSSKSTTPQYYTVEPGDCLGLIAERFHTPIADLCRMNNMKLEDQDKIRIGQKLRVK